MQVYLGKWHSSEVAIKCLNPSLFFSGSDGTASKAAMADLLREADLLASLRHPNVVWVYGVVLPRMVRNLPAGVMRFPCMEALHCHLCRLLPVLCLHSSINTAPRVLAHVSSHDTFHQHGQLLLLNGDVLGFQAVTGLSVAGRVCALSGGASLLQGPDEKGNLMMEDVEPIPITSGATLGRTCSNLRPPAVVTEFMSQGSVKSALARKSEVVVGNMHRVVVAMDAAKV